MRQQIISFNAIKVGIKHILKQVHYLPKTEQKAAIQFIVKSVESLKTLINLNNGRLKHRRLLFSKCIAKCRSSDGFYRFVIRRKADSLKSRSPKNNTFNDDCVNNYSDSSDVEIYTKSNNEIEVNKNSSPQSIEEVRIIAKNLNTIQEEYSNYNLPCSICGEISNNYSIITIHLFNHSGSPISCIKCKHSFNNITMFKIHQNVDCTQSRGLTLSDFLLHLISVVKKFGQKTACGFHCPYCGKGMVKPCNLKRHLKETSCGENNAPYHCIECNLKFRNEEKYTQHLQKHSKYKCSKCELSFSSKKSLKKHTETHPKVPPKIHTCELCNLEFPKRLQYKEHITKHNQDKTLSPAEKLWRVWCDVCRMSFFDSFTYKRHCTRYSHLSKVTDDKELLNMKTFMCVQCGQIFMTKVALNTHCSRIHSNKASLTCDKCTYTTQSKPNLKRHMLTHSNTVNDKKFFCHQCPLSFTTSSRLKEHIASVHVEERLFGCDVCPQTFKLKKLLLRHKAIHSPSLPFVCVHCSVGFKRKSHLKRHTEARHKEHVSKPPVMQDALGETSKLLPMPPITIDNKDIRENIQGDNRVFSLIDAQSGELVTLSATELSKNAVINMADGELLNEVHIPELWNPNGMYTLDPLLESNVLPQPQYNIITHDGNEMSHMLQKTLESTSDKNSIQYCIVPPDDVQPQRSQDELSYFYVQ